MVYAQVLFFTLSLFLSNFSLLLSYIWQFRWGREWYSLYIAQVLLLYLHFLYFFPFLSVSLLYRTVLGEGESEIVCAQVLFSYPFPFISFLSFQFFSVICYCILNRLVIGLKESELVDIKHNFLFLSHILFISFFFLNPLSAYSLPVACCYIEQLNYGWGRKWASLYKAYFLIFSHSFRFFFIFSTVSLLILFPLPVSIENKSV